VTSDSSESSRIEAKLDTLVRLVALTLISDDQSIKETAVLLKRAGLEPREIAELCGTTRNTVSVALTNAKNGKTGKKRRK
jgi:hypothetical protein